jgi:D-alanyl-D-alanine carboxypeptidase
VFKYHGRAMRNQNHLLGVVDGIDGIKTGYIRASGFNLVASMRRDCRHLVAVVIGGKSGRARDARMRQLLEGAVKIASVRRTAPMIAESAPALPTPRRAAKPVVVASAAADDGEVSTRGLDLPSRGAEPPALPPTRGKARVEEGSADPIKPILVRTISVRRGGTHVARNTATGDNDDIAAASRAAPRGGWMIQVGAFPEESVAKDRLKAVKSVAPSMLAAAEPFTMRIVKRDATLYRARFAGLDRDEAVAACKYLKRNDIACLALKN